MVPASTAKSAPPKGAASESPVVASNELKRTKVWGETDQAVSWAGAFAVYGGHGATASSTIVYEIEPGKRLGWHTDATEETQYIIAGQGKLYLEDGSTHAVGPGSGVVLFFVDLDGFKRLNDTLGHPTGDAVLRLLAERLRRCAHDGDTVARLGGDEFAIVHPVSPGSKSPTAMAAEIVRSIARPYDVGGSQLTLTASVGVSVAGEDCQEPDRMLKNADVALYRAKTDGRNAFRFYDASMDNYL
jgi:diguanylate cyclase (GGDEF)-like protein